jgi:predicted transcriptional regulator YheO
MYPATAATARNPKERQSISHLRSHSSNPKKENAMATEEIMEGMSTQLTEALKSLAKAKSVEEKVAYSQIVKNLSESMGVFLNLAADGMMEDYDFDED